MIAFTVVDATKSMRNNAVPMTDEQQRALTQHVTSTQDPCAPQNSLSSSFGRAAAGLTERCVLGAVTQLQKLARQR